MAGRFASESVADFKRNGWPIWNGIGGRFGAESPTKAQRDIFKALDIQLPGMA